MTALCHGVTFPPVPTMAAVAAPVLFTENVCWVLGAVMGWADSEGKHRWPLLSEGAELSTHGRLPLGPGPPSLTCQFFLFLSPTSGGAATTVPPPGGRGLLQACLPHYSLSYTDTPDTGRTAQFPGSVQGQGSRSSVRGRSALQLLPELSLLFLSVPAPPFNLNPGMFSSAALRQYVLISMYLRATLQGPRVVELSR